MSVIKCKYAIPYCARGGDIERVKHNEYFCCDNDEGCFLNSYRPNTAKYPNVANPPCIWCVYGQGQFEKTVKNYEYVSMPFNLGYLKLYREMYSEWEIEYLEIDGEVIIGEKGADDE